MDNMDVMLLHEQYQPPTVGVGEVVLVKFRNRNCWVIGYVQPPQVSTWKPGEPLGKRISVHVPSMNRLVDDIVHIGDPLHQNSPEIYHTVWECCTPGQIRNVQGSLVEIQSAIGRLKSDLSVVEQKLRSQEQEISKLKAAVSFKGKKEKETELAVA